jgi:hypothetical protein
MAMRDNVTPYDTFGLVTHVTPQSEANVTMTPKREPLPIIVRKFDYERLALGIDANKR